MNKQTIAKPKISIIIPNYNNAIYLDECIESVLNQTYKNLEIIIVDDCSTDNSINIIEKYIHKDPRIKLIKNIVNSNVSKSRNIGIEQSTSKWITTLDSDDFYWQSDKIEKEVTILIRQQLKPNTIAYSGIVTTDEKGREKHQVMSKERTKEGSLFTEILQRDCAIPRDFIFSKEMYFKVGGFNTNIPIYEDWDLKIRLAKFCKFFYTKINGIGYRRHGKGLSSAKSSEHKKWILKIFNSYAMKMVEKEKFLLKLKSNVNLGKDLTQEEMEILVQNILDKSIRSEKSSFSIWGIGQMTYKITEVLSQANININFYIDSRAKNKEMIFADKKVITIEEALNKNEKNIILASWNKQEVLLSILKQNIKAKNLKHIFIITPSLRNNK